MPVSDRRKEMVRRSKFLYILIFAGAVVLVNVFAGMFYTRIDFTGDKRFTVHPKTREVLGSAREDIEVTVFLGGDLPAPFRRLRLAVQDLLADYKAISKASIRIVMDEPLAGADAARRDTVIYQLGQIGIEPVAVNIKTDEGFTQKLIFPMAMITSNGRQLPVKLLQNLDANGLYEENINNSIRNLEYTFTSAIRRIQSGVVPRIGFTEGHGELSDAYLNDALQSLGDSYEVGRVDLKQISREGLDKLKLLIVAKPQTAFTEAEKYKLNYFAMRGGSIVWSIDQVTAELDSLGRKSNQLAINKNLNLDDMLFEYGARINYNLVADANCADIPLSMGGANAQLELAPWPYYPILMPDAGHNLVKNIDGIRSEFLSTIDTIASRGIKKTAILTTSPYNIVYNTPKMFSLQMVAEQADVKAFTRKPQMGGVLLEGKFPSVFVNRPVPAEITENYQVPALGAEAKMIVLGDGDIFKNQVSSRDGSAFALGFDRYSQRTFGNKSLLLNIADYMTGDENLIDLRNKEITIRLLDKTRLRSEKTFWQLFNITLPIGLLVIFGIYQHYYRRYKYAK
jgi:ABC-2 type transport system permease protein